MNEQEYDWTDNHLWMKTKDRIILDLNVVENVNKVIGVYAQRTVFRDNFRFDDLDNEDVFKLPSDVTIQEAANINYFTLFTDFGGIGIRVFKRGRN